MLVHCKNLPCRRPQRHPCLNAHTRNNACRCPRHQHRLGERGGGISYDGHHCLCPDDDAICVLQPASVVLACLRTRRSRCWHVKSVKAIGRAYDGMGSARCLPPHYPNIEISSANNTSLSAFVSFPDRPAAIARSS